MQKGVSFVTSTVSVGYGSSFEAASIDTTGPYCKQVLCRGGGGGGGLHVDDMTGE